MNMVTSNDLLETKGLTTFLSRCERRAVEEDPTSAIEEKLLLKSRGLQERVETRVTVTSNSGDKNGNSSPQHSVTQRDCSWYASCMIYSTSMTVQCKYYWCQYDGSRNANLR